jgi:hypothetical protein
MSLEFSFFLQSVKVILFLYICNLNCNFMTATALQNELIREIPRINNIATLESLKMIINQDETPVVLTDFQKKLIEISLEEYKRGEFIEHNVLMDQLAQKYGW